MTIWKYNNQQTRAISTKEFAYIISVLHKFMDARQWRNEAIEIQACKLSMNLSKTPKFG